MDTCLYYASVFKRMQRETGAPLKSYIVYRVYAIFSPVKKNPTSICEENIPDVK